MKINPLAIKCVQLKDELGRAGLYRTMQAMDKVVYEIGYELAERITIERDDDNPCYPYPCDPRDRT
jgi:hypothetical protein